MEGAAGRRAMVPRLTPRQVNKVPAPRTGSSTAHRMTYERYFVDVTDRWMIASWCAFVLANTTRT